MEIPLSTIQPFGQLGVPHLALLQSEVTPRQIHDAIFDKFCKEAIPSSATDGTEDELREEVKLMLARWMHRALIDAGIAAGASCVRVWSRPMRLNSKHIYGIHYDVDFKIGDDVPYSRELEQYFV